MIYKEHKDVLHFHRLCGGLGRPRQHDADRLRGAGHEAGAHQGICDPTAPAPEERQLHRAQDPAQETAQKATAAATAVKFHNCQ